ncbi:MAG: efflux RND transporter periplasmic adaptor subunit [Phycisphaeraceae bacterium]|nr:efflux RND transporter periplasmic adaptor subunit [Phycisphaeraceae bacterium]
MTDQSNPSNPTPHAPLRAVGHARRASEPAHRGERIPLPPRTLVTRVLIPLLILGGAVATLIIAAYESLRPVPTVRVAPVVAISRTADSAGSGPASGPPERAPAPSPSASRWVQAPGWIEPEPLPTTVSALRDGIVVELLALEGDPVEAGQVVARLEARTLELALARAEAELARANATRERALAMAEQARTEQAQLPHRRAAAEARLEAARDASARADRLGAAHAMGEAEVVRYRQAMLEARAELEAIEPLARSIAAAERAAEAEAATALLVPQAMLDEVRLQLGRSEVRSPIDGVVMEVLTSPGENLFAGDMAMGRAVVTLYDPKRLQVRTDVPLADAAGLAVGQRARVTVEVLPDQVFEGVVSRLVHKADIQKNTVGVKVSLRNPSPELKPDMLARVRIEVTSGPPRGGATPARTADGALSPDTIGTPSRLHLLAHGDALIGSGPERVAMVVTSIDRGRGRLEPRQVTISGDAPRAGWITVTHGLQPGDRVVLKPDTALSPGTMVAIATEWIDPEGERDVTR